MRDKKNSLFMTVKSVVSRVGHLYATWTLPRGEGTPVWKKNGILVASQSGRVSRFICLFELVCTNIRLHFAAISRATKIEQIVLCKTRRPSKRLLSPSLRRHGIIYNHGLNKVANRFGVLNYLSAYNNNKIISEDVGKSFCSLNSGSWLLVPDSRYDVSIWLKPLLKNAGSIWCQKCRTFATCELRCNSGRNNSFNGLRIGFLPFVLFCPKTTWFGFWCVNWWLRNFSRTAGHDAELRWTGHRRWHEEQIKASTN